MPKTCLSVLTLLLSAALLNARNSSKPCGLAYQMQQAELPQDIAVKADPLTSGATKIAMDWWVARLSTPVRPTTWHTVQGLDECMIYIRHGWENMMSNN